MKDLFGQKQSLDDHLSYSSQFIELSEEQLQGEKLEAEIPKRLKAYIVEFDGTLDHDEYNTPHFFYRLLFKRKLVNRPGQADKVIDFIDSKSDLAKAIDKEYWVKKEVEKKKYRPSGIVAEVKNAGFQNFRINPEHVEMWKSEDAKNPGKGYGVEVEGCCYWYENWLKRCIKLCSLAGDKYI